MNRTNTRMRQQFRYLGYRINVLKKSGKWDSLTSEVKQKLLSKLKGMYEMLAHFYHRGSLIKGLGTLALMLGLSHAGNAQASFGTPVKNPFNIQRNSYVNLPSFADLDGDGDQDLVLLDYDFTLQYHENIGTNQNPNFQSGTVLDTNGYRLNPTFADLDNDGDLDMLRSGIDYGAYSQEIYYYENVGSSTNPSFTGFTVDPFNLSSNTIMYTQFVDLDNDGDFDILAIDFYYGGFKYYQNTGTNSNPAFANAVNNPFNLSGIYATAMDLADFDNDGDLDVLTLDYYGNFQYYQNTGSASSPAFGTASLNPFGLSAPMGAGTPSFFDLVDLDNDGDVDLFFSEYYGDMYYYENMSPMGETELDMSLVDIYPNPTQNYINIQLVASRGVGQVSLTDLSGKVLIEEETNASGQLKMKVDHLPKGIYFLGIKQEDKIGIEKVIIQ